MAAEKSLEYGWMHNCLIIPWDTTGRPLFYSGDGPLVATLQGYAIVPASLYEELDKLEDYGEAYKAHVSVAYPKWQAAQAQVEAEGVAPTKGFLNDCYIIMRADSVDAQMFYGDEDGRLIATLDGYAILPIDLWNIVIGLEGATAVVQAYCDAMRRGESAPGITALRCHAKSPGVAFGTGGVRT